MKKILYISILLLLLFAGCVDRYPRCQDNLYLYIPQIRTGQAKNLYVSLHKTDGQYVYSQYFSDPKSSSNPEGLIHLEVPKGVYQVLCYANVDSLKVTQMPLNTQSYVSKILISDNPPIFKPASALMKGDKIVDASCSSCKMIIDTINVDLYTGVVKTILENFPIESNLVSLIYTGFGTHLPFKGSLYSISNSRVKKATPRSQFLYEIPNAVKADSDRNIVLMHNVFPTTGQVGLLLHVDIDGGTTIDASEFLDQNIHLVSKDTLIVRITHNVGEAPTIKAILHHWQADPDDSENVEM